MTDGVFDAFTMFVQARWSGKFKPELLRQESEFIRLRLRYGLAIAAYGAVTADQVFVESDPQVARALAVLPEARRLADNAARARMAKR